MWDRLPEEVQIQIIDKGLDVWAIDAYRVAKECELGARINTVMQPCFFALAGVLPVDEAIGFIKASVRKSYGSAGTAIVERNDAAIDASLAALARVSVPATATPERSLRTVLPADAARLRRAASPFPLMAGDGDLLPVSALPVDGTFPTGTAKYEKRAIAQEIPIWDPDICIDCGKCAIVCPHATIRMKVYEPSSGRRRSDGLPVQGLPLQGHRRLPHDDPGGAGRLHRLRGLRRRVPGRSPRPR